MLAQFRHRAQTGLIADDDRWRQRRGQRTDRRIDLAPPIAIDEVRVVENLERRVVAGVADTRLIGPLLHLAQRVLCAPGPDHRIELVAMGDPVGVARIARIVAQVAASDQVRKPAPFAVVCRAEHDQLAVGRLICRVRCDGG